MRICYYKRGELERVEYLTEHDSSCRCLACLLENIEKLQREQECEVEHRFIPRPGRRWQYTCARQWGGGNDYFFGEAASKEAAVIEVLNRMEVEEK